MDLDRHLRVAQAIAREARGDRLGDRDEGDRIGHLEHRERVTLRPPEDRARDLVMAEAESESEPPHAGGEQPANVRAVGRGGLPDPHAGRQQQLAAGQPRGRIGQLGRVHPPNRMIEPSLARRDGQAEAGELKQVTHYDRQGHFSLVFGQSV